MFSRYILFYRILEPRTEPEAKKSKGAQKKKNEKEETLCLRDPRSENVTQWQSSYTQGLLLECGLALSLD